jgi:hypothetical protein
MLGLGIIALVLIVLAGLWFFLLRSPATRVDLRQALRIYRKAQNSKDLDHSMLLPPPGVYSYRTSGGEQLSIGGISRVFPASTDMIVTDARCANFDWEPLEQHTEGLVACRQKNGALTILSATSYEQIAGTQTTSVIRCPADTYFIPAHPTAGERWHKTCRSKGETVVFSGQIVGASSIVVSDQRVPALHTRLTLSFSGSESGTNPNNYWVSLQSGVILRQQETVAVSEKAGPLGSVRYTENMAIRLRSMAPIR